MSLSFDLAIAACVLAPFVFGALAPLLQRAGGWRAGVILSLVPAAIGGYFLTLVPRVASGEVLRASFEWIPAYGIDFAFLVDGLSLTFALTICGIGTLIFIYAAAYLRGHPHQDRFTAIMLWFTGSMLGLVLIDGAIPLYIFWELTSVTSFLLIGFEHTREAARRAAVHSLIVTNIGGLALLVGGIALYLTTGDWSLSSAGAGHTFLMAMLILAAFTKSAQVPFHFWLLGAMQAPTPVSAYLHSATMVQAGVYLLARIEPVFGSTGGWMWTLCAFGGGTLLWGALVALRHTDLKQMLAMTTVGTLGLLVLLLGLGAVEAALVYFVAHALYKAALFLIAGILSSETGTAELTALGGLRNRMRATFIAAILTAPSMIGVPPALGFFGKEEGYAAALGAPVAAAMLIAGNAMMIAVALALAVRPFLGREQPTPRQPGSGGPLLLLGPLVLGAGGIVTPWMNGAFGVHAHLVFEPASLVFWLSVLTWALGAIIFWRLAAIRAALRRSADAIAWTADRGFDALMFALIRAAALITRTLHHGRLELYLVLVFAVLAVAIGAPLVFGGGLPTRVAVPSLTFYEWGIIALATAGVVAVLFATTRLFAILALGVQGGAVALLYLLFGAPDLSYTQFMVEILSVVILALVMTRLRLDRSDPREFEDFLRDGTIALLCGVGIVALMLTILDAPFDARLSEFFTQHSVTEAHGRNIVNVILVDFRGLDTLGEISVVMTAGIAILALIRGERRRARSDARVLQTEAAA